MNTDAKSEYPDGSRGLTSRRRMESGFQFICVHLCSSVVAFCKILPMRIPIPIVTAGLLLAAPLLASAQTAWQNKLRQQLPYLGHRNWIVVADSAYPLQIAEGIETVYADADQLQVVKTVLDELSNSKHVRPMVYIDQELQYVPEKDARGISVYRDNLSRLLPEHATQALPHEDIIAKLDQAGRTFRVLVIKTRLTLPYTSVFLQLDCAYWNAESEKALRDAMKAGPTR